jgi:hypothetical protein
MQVVDIDKLVEFLRSVITEFDLFVNHGNQNIEGINKIQEINNNIAELENKKVQVLESNPSRKVKISRAMYANKYIFAVHIAGIKQKYPQQYINIAKKDTMKNPIH